MDPKAFTCRWASSRFDSYGVCAGWLCSDLGVVWLSDPRPSSRDEAEGTALLPLADVGVSADVTSGNTFFTQSLQELNGFVPACVHAIITFQFLRHGRVHAGQRSRLQEKGL